MSRLGWRGSGVWDQRDLEYSYRKTFAQVATPMVVDLIKGPIVDQGNIGSCGPFSATSNMVGTDEHNTGQPKNLSQLWLYYRYRERFGHVEYDDGVFNRELVKVLAEDGVCLEEDWPYVLANWDKKPPPETYEKAKANKIKSYHALYTIDDMIQCIASGYGFFGGIGWYESADSLYTEKTGRIEMPSGRLLGGHDLYFCKYDQNEGVFGGPNSWGCEWGDRGMFTVPFYYLADQRLAGGFYSIQQ